MATWYNIGDQPRVTVTFTNLAGTATDPTAISCAVQSPQGSRTYAYGVDPEVTKTSTGVYNLDLTLAAAKEYRYKWSGTGALVASEQGRIAVRKATV